MGPSQEGGSLPAGTCGPTRNPPQERLDWPPGLQQTLDCREVGPSITGGTGPFAARPGSSQPLALKGGWTGPAQAAHARGSLTAAVRPAWATWRDVGAESSETTRPRTPVHQRPTRHAVVSPARPGSGGRGRRSLQEEPPGAPGCPSASRPPALPGTLGLGLMASMLQPGGQWEPLPCRRGPFRGCGPSARCPGGLPGDAIDLRRGDV